MKRVLLAIILAVSAVFATACAQADSSAVERNESYIGVMSLTPEAQEIVNLLKGGSTVTLDNYSVSSQFKSVEIILRVYQKGQLVDTQTCGAQNLVAPDGKIAVTSESDSPTEFKISLENGNGIATWQLSSPQVISGLNTSALLGLPARTTIKEGEDYPLFARVFTASSGWAVSADMLSSPEKLKDFEYTYIIKSRFSTEELPH